MRKPILFVVIAVVAILTACNPSGGQNLPEGTPDLNGTFAEYKAKLVTASGNAQMSDEEAAVYMLTPLLRCIYIEHPEMVNATRESGVYQFVGKDSGDGTMTLAYYGEMTLSEDDVISFNGRLQLDEFVFSVNGSIGAETKLSINGKAYDVSGFQGM